jgi:sugar phosphate isomerase/epimerase
MSNRRTFLKNFSLLTLGGLAGEKALASNHSFFNGSEVPSVMNTEGKKQMGLQTYSSGQELLKDMPNGLKRLAKMGYTELEIFGYRGDSGKFGDYSRANTTFIAAKDYFQMAEDAGLLITSSHLTPSIQEYTAENMPKFDEFWKKATDVHFNMNVKYMVQPSLPRIQSEDDAKRVAEIFNRAGEITKQAGITWGYHNHSNEFKTISKDGVQDIPKSPFEKPQGPFIEELFLKNTDPDKVVFELDVYWAMMAQQDPVEWINKYSQRYKLLHIKDRWIIGDSGMLNFANIFKAGYKNGMTNYFVELEGNPENKVQFEGVEKSAMYLKKASFVK